MIGGSLGEPARQPRLWPRFVVFALIIALVVTALGLRLFTLQIVSGGYYAGLAHLRPCGPPVGQQRGYFRDQGASR
jgi:hypothetical protein